MIEGYDAGGVDRPSCSELIGPLGLEAQENSDLAASLKTLTSNPGPTMMPVFPR